MKRPLCFFAARAAVLFAVVLGSGACATVRPSRPSETASALSLSTSTLDSEIRSLETGNKLSMVEADVHIRSALRALADALERVPGPSTTDARALATQTIRDAETGMAVLTPAAKTERIDVPSARRALEAASAALLDTARRDYAAFPDVLVEALKLDASVRSIDSRAAPAAQHHALLVALHEADQVLRAMARRVD